MSPPLRKRPTWGTVRDGIIEGRMEMALRSCDVCDIPTCVIRIEGYTLPPEVNWAHTILRLKNNARQPVAVFIGVGCGCYAKLHRQVAHVQDKVLASKAR